MKKSEKILRKNSIPEYLPPFTLEKEVIKNTTLLKHIIDNDLRHIWRLIFVLVGLIAGLYAKSFFGG